MHILIPYRYGMIVVVLLDVKLLMIPMGINFVSHSYAIRARGGVVAKALLYKPEGRGFNSRWCHWNFSLA
jgi:hypothetical protein